MLKAGALVKHKYSNNYYVLNKIIAGNAFLDGQSESVSVELLETDTLCDTFNNPKPMEQIKMESKQQGGVKNDAGKQPITLIPSDYVLGTAGVFAFGGRKYGLNNFRLGMAHSRCLDAAFRHLLAIANGEEIDPESGLPHIYHASCSLAMYDYMRLHYPELNDIFELTKGATDGKK